MLGALDADHLDVGDDTQPLHRLVGTQVVVELGHECDHWLARTGPFPQMFRAAVPQGRAEQDDPLDRRVVAVHQSEVGAERPPEQPAVYQRRVLGELGELDRRGDVEAFVSGLVEAALGRPSRGGRATGVEPQDGDVGQRRETVGRLLQEVTVHEAAVGGQRVQGDQGGDRIPIQWQG